MPAQKILGIVASYRKVGNSEIVTKAVARRLGEGWELSLTRLPTLRVLPCKGCYACLMPGVGCNLDDDVEWLFERIEEADAVVVAAPNYTLGPVGMVKLLSDRAFQAAVRAARFLKKPTAVALTLGQENYRGYSDTALASQVRVLGLRVVALEHFLCTHPGEVAVDPGFEAKIGRLADSLAGGAPAGDPAPDRCPRCFSDLFRVREDEVECAICKARARVVGGALEFTSFHPLFTDQGRKEHLEWLLMKKEEYGRTKERLRAVQEGYREGEWVAP